MYNHFSIIYEELQNLLEKHSTQEKVQLDNHDFIEDIRKFLNC